MQDLRRLIADHETWLMERVLDYAKRHRYTQYTSTLLEAWRISIVGLSDSILAALESYDGPPEMGPDEDFTQDPIASFGMLEARRHRQRGVTLSMFMGLMKYYRQSYVDLVNQAGFEPAIQARYRLFVDRCFDRLEIGYCTAWAEISGQTQLHELQVTNRRMTNEKNRYLTIFESLHDPAILLNAEGEVENANQAAAELFQRETAGAPRTPGSLYYYEDEVVAPAGGSSDASSQPALTMPWLTGRMAAFQDRTADEVTFEETLDTPHRGRRIFVVKLKKMLDVSEKFSGTVVILHDVTEERRASRALSESHERLEATLQELQTTQAQMLQQERLAAIGQLAAGVAHEFNNMMAPVILYSDMLQQGIPLPASEQQKLQVIGEQGRRAAELTQQILDFSRQSMLRRQSVNLVTLVERVQQLLVHTLPERIKLKLKVSAQTVMAEVDPTRIQQALMNLAFNARDAMPEGGTLTIEVAYQDHVTPQAQIIVSDTGSGIPDEVLPHIYEPFFTTKEAGEGTGLGLAQVYGIVGLHNGEIDVATEVGKGTTFTLALPAMAVSGLPTPSAAGKTAPAYRRGSGETILVVEDDPTVQQALVAALEMLQYAPITAGDGEAACELLASRSAAHGGLDVDLVLSDWAMSPMGGDDLARRIAREGLDVPVVLVTGFPLDQTPEASGGGASSAVGLAQDAEVGEDVRIHGWIQKPIDLQQLSDVIARALAA
jgi:signal transduction histidine kinase